ncbi:hypothetical protein OU415_00325 [Saccharopolyspora sp. WRP15-2]|uniref:DivIVA protein n=1 Tax=Saccharopolyspora oryzae TaxID=2997343 RepID=A0ABT4UQ56_9PSEU|nr:hypothetical protein [Saccharopolyspora oryzae]MDA3623855.1 hypothetical protein [Saccharopolyspora oryzae]
MNDVVPARPDFAGRWRGFDRAQVIEHVALLEAEVRRLRDELSAKDSGPTPDSEIVEFAEKRATTIIEQAQAQAEVVLAEAEQAAEQIRTQASDLARRLARRQAALDREAAQLKREHHEREHRLRRNVRREYKRITSIAQHDAEGLLDRTRQRCERRNAESEERSRRICEQAERQRREAGTALESLLHEVVKQSTELRGLSLPNAVRGEPRSEQVGHRGYDLSVASETDAEEQHLHGA